MERPLKPNTLVLIQQDGEPTFRLLTEDPGEEGSIRVYDPLLKRERALHSSRITPLCETSGPYYRNPDRLLAENWKKVVNALSLEVFRLKEKEH